MILRETPLPGAFVIELEPQSDERGFFARTFCREEFERAGLNANVAQSSISYNRTRGTLRGMHLQTAPHEETRRVRCTRGRIFDVIVDMRRDSATRHDWFGIELSAANHLQLIVPEGFAHGFQTLEDDTEVHYDMSVPYEPDACVGYHYASPAFAIEWPLTPVCVSERDKNLGAIRPSGAESSGAGGRG